MLSFAPDGLITADLGNIKEAHFMCRAKFLQHYANDRMRAGFRVVRNETDVHLIVRPHSNTAESEIPGQAQDCGKIEPALQS